MFVLQPSTNGKGTGQLGLTPPAKISAILTASGPGPSNAFRPTVDWSLAAASKSSDRGSMFHVVPPSLRTALIVSLVSSPTLLYGLVLPRARLALSADVLPSGAGLLRNVFVNLRRSPSKNRKVTPEVSDMSAPPTFNQVTIPAPGDIFEPIWTDNIDTDQKSSVLHATPSPQSSKKLMSLFRPVLVAGPPVRIP